MLNHLLYVSEATRPMSDADLDALLATARHFNQEHGITGVLFYRGGQFLQLLEGDASQLRELYQRIERDPRHLAVEKLLDRPVDQRFFPDWSMALQELTPDTATNLGRALGDADPAALGQLHANREAGGPALRSAILHCLEAATAER